MEKKQTAVEYLVEELIKQGFFKRLPIIAIQQASQMEKEQIEEAYTDGQTISNAYQGASHYYNTEYGDEN
jgi:hypothetical protein